MVNFSAGPWKPRIRLHRQYREEIRRSRTLLLQIPSLIYADRPTTLNVIYVSSVSLRLDTLMRDRGLPRNQTDSRILIVEGWQREEVCHDKRGKDGR